MYTHIYTPIYLYPEQHKFLQPADTDQLVSAISYMYVCACRSHHLACVCWVVGVPTKDNADSASLFCTWCLACRVKVPDPPSLYTPHLNLHAHA